MVTTSGRHSGRVPAGTLDTVRLDCDVSLDRDLQAKNAHDQSQSGKAESLGCAVICCITGTALRPSPNSSAAGLEVLSVWSRSTSLNLWMGQMAAPLPKSVNIKTNFKFYYFFGT